MNATSTTAAPSFESIVPAFDQAEADAALSAFLANRTPENRSRLVAANIRTACTVVVRVTKSGDQHALREGLGDAVIGLFDALNGYDPTKGRFSTYSYWCARNEVIANWLREQKHQRRCVSMSDLEEANSDGGNDGQGASEIAGNELPPDVLASQREAEENRVRRADIIHAIKMAMPGDKWRNYRVTTYLNYVRGMQYGCVGAMLGVTRQRVHTIAQCGVRKVRQYLKACGVLRQWERRYRDWVAAREAIVA